MPIYDYRCTACGFEQEYLQKISDPLKTTCPACHQETLVKKLTAAGFQLKGSGWYATDFRNGGAPKPAADAKPAGDAAPASAGESAAEAKPSTESSAAPSPAPAPATGGSTS